MEGFILEGANGFFSRCLECVDVPIDCAYVHSGTLEDMKELIEKQELPVIAVYPAKEEGLEVSIGKPLYFLRITHFVPFVSKLPIQ